MNTQLLIARYPDRLDCLDVARAAPPPASQSAAQTPTQRIRKRNITLDVTRVSMLFTVSDKKGRFVNNLSKDDFEIFEAKKPQSIVEFTAETNLPLRLAILIDTSNSIRERFKFQQEAATDFVNTVVRAARGQGDDRELRHCARNWSPT